MKIDAKTIVIVILIALFALKGGDSPSPTPSDELAAKQAGVAYLSSLADVFENYELPESEAEFGEPFNKKVMEVYADSFQVIDDTLSQKEYPYETKAAMKDMAKGFRGAVE